VPAPLARLVRSFAGGQAAALELESAVVPPVAPVMIPLRSRVVWPSARDKARILHESAAEVEHAPMVQYLPIADDAGSRPTSCHRSQRFTSSGTRFFTRARAGAGLACVRPYTGRPDLGRCIAVAETQVADYSCGALRGGSSLSSASPCQPCGDRVSCP
jgi:hypothetical protein